MVREVEQKWLLSQGGLWLNVVKLLFMPLDRMIGGIARDYTGQVMFHARDVFTPATTKLAAQLRVVAWAIESFRDLHLPNVVDCSVEALKNLRDWPLYPLGSHYSCDNMFCGL